MSSSAFSMHPSISVLPRYRTHRELLIIPAIHREQELQNYVAVNDYHRAISLALSLAHPGRLYNLFKDISSDKHEDGTLTALDLPFTR